MQFILVITNKNVYMKYTSKIVIISLGAALLLRAVDKLISALFMRQDASHAILFQGVTPHETLTLSFLMVALFLYGLVITKSVLNDQLRKEIFDRTRSEEDRRRSERFLGTIFDSIHDPFSIVDRNYKIVKVNDAYARMKKKLADELLGKPCYKVLHGRSDICEECVIEKTFRSSDPCAKEKLIMNSDGQEVWLEIYTYPVFDEQGTVSHVIEYARDITDRKMAEEEKKRLIKELNYLSTIDGLTGLFNRRALNDLLGYEIDRAKRYQSELSLIICDIDWFKQINDTCGHRAGDIALQAVTGALKHALRKADILGRYGGDEFMLILPETSLTGAKNLAEKIRAAIEDIKLVISEGKVIRLSMSIGVAGCCVSEEDLDTIVARADAALYASKQAGRNRVSVEPV